MAKRMICLSLVLILILGLLPVTVSAQEPEIGLRLLDSGESYSEMFVSQNLLDIIKDVEGFSATPYWDVSQWTIGYGTACGYKWSEKPNLTVTREEAEEMLLADVTEKYGKIVNDYCASIGRQPNQQQFDALVDFTYNLGGSWTKGCQLTDWLENPTTELDFVNAIGRWGRISSVTSYATCMRRVREAVIFMKGEYYLTYGGGTFETELSVVSNNNLPYYRVVIFLCDGGRIDGLADDMRYYFTGDAYPELPVPTRAGYVFLGWQVVMERGSSVAEPYMLKPGMMVEQNLKVTALWEPSEEEETTEPEATEPEPTEPEETKPEVTEPAADAVMGTVKSDKLTIRTGPGVDYESVGLLSKGDRVAITEQKSDGTRMWGKIAEGWICMDYVLLDGEEEESTEPEVTEPEPTEPETEYPMGTVKSDKLTIRTGPGLEYESVGLLSKGDRVAIQKQQSDGARMWGKIKAGWICMDYVLMDGAEEESTEPEETEPEGEVVMGTVKTSALTIRTGPGAEYASVGLVHQGDRVTITKQQSDGSRMWGKIEAGWICLDYVLLDGEEEEPTEPEVTEPETTKPEVTEPEEDAVMGTVTTAALTIRTGPGAEYESVGLLSKGDRVAITGQESDGTRMWGKIAEGWICMDYVLLDGEEEPTQPTEPTQPEPTEPETTMPFEDVSTGHWYYDCVEFVYRNGYMNGVSGTRFGAEEAMTRGMLVTVLYRMAGAPEVSADQMNQFEDVRDTDYFADAVAWAKENGIVNGVSATAFAPDRKVSRQDAITIFHRYYVNYLNHGDNTTQGLEQFSDHELVASYARDSIAWAVEAGLVSGSKTAEGILLKPLDDLTRAQAAQLMYKLASLITNAG